jgi:hypothetical protein
MSKQRILMIVALCFVLIGTVAAGIPHEPRPDSVASCLGAYGDPMDINTFSAPASIDPTECEKFQGFNCSTCIRSLERQGCDILDVNTFNIPEEGRASKAVFVLSCESP